MNIDELCQWLKPKLDDENWNDVEQVIRNQRIRGKNFLNCPEAKWETFGLEWGVANSLFQIAQGVLRDGAQTQEIKEKSTVQRISEAGALAVDHSLFFSTLNKSLIKQCGTPPIVKSDDGKLLAVCCSDFLINEEMTEGFQQYFFLRDEAKREMDFCKEFLSKQSPRAAVIGGSPGTGKSLTLFTWAWL
jgi:hypothetical protein